MRTLSYIFWIQSGACMYSIGLTLRRIQKIILKFCVLTLERSCNVSVAWRRNAYSRCTQSCIMVSITRTGLSILGGLLFRSIRLWLHYVRNITNKVCYTDGKQNLTYQNRTGYEFSGLYVGFCTDASLLGSCAACLICLCHVTEERAHPIWTVTEFVSDGLRNDWEKNVRRRYIQLNKISGSMFLWNVETKLLCCSKKEYKTPLLNNCDIKVE
jgi:hypothetical protein